ncbi:MAG: 30S ribosomal protein S16 [Proteobacteria bacterium]|nr:30S ribosomal protein S16 [Pseudomonadota bacterium]
MVKIRLSRGGAKKRPFYHIVATDHRNKRDGRSLERLGFFNPIASGNDKRLELDMARVQHWLDHGAQLSDKVGLLVKEAATQAKAAA